MPMSEKKNFISITSAYKFRTLRKKEQINSKVRRHEEVITSAKIAEIERNNKIEKNQSWLYEINETDSNQSNQEKKGLKKLNNIIYNENDITTETSDLKRQYHK